MNDNVLFLCAREFTVGFIYATLVVTPLQALMVMVGLVAEFNVEAVMLVSACLSAINLCMILYLIQLQTVDEEEEE